MAVKRYDGSQWVTVAGKGDQGTSSSIATWVKTASGGETSVSGNDDNSQPLSYTVGQELVFINGALQKRGSDYTATTGNSITGLTALAANDVVTVWTVNAFSVTNAISNTLVDAKGDLIVATGADTPGRLAVGSANQVLTVDSSTGTGLKWATPSSGAMTFITKNTFSNVANVTIDNIFSSSYDNYEVYMEVQGASTGDDIILQMVYSGNIETGSYYYGSLLKVYTTTGIKATQGTGEFPFLESTANAGGFVKLTFQNVGNASEKAQWHGTGVTNDDIACLIGGYCTINRTFTGIYLKSSSSNITGFVTVYGLAKS